jgi:hypothetical protein
VLVSDAGFGHGGVVSETCCIRGRKIDAEDLDQIRSWIAAHPQWSRRRLSQELALRWDWRTPTGQLKDIATRDLLNRLEARGLIALPPRQRRGGRQRPRALEAAAQFPLPLPATTEPAQAVALAQLLPLSWHLARGGQPERALIARRLDEHHYLGYPDPLGQLHYLARDRNGRELACLLFGPASWKVAARDAFIGWSDAQRQKGLGHLANNSRFLILPGVKAPHLASHLLAAAARRLRTDWRDHHGRALWLLETFVERERFAGTCYRAANWIKAGQTRGRTRNDRDHRIQSPVKDVYLLALVPDLQRRLCAL